MCNPVECADSNPQYNDSIQTRTLFPEGNLRNLTKCNPKSDGKKCRYASIRRG